jgi:hypothetical protein
MILAGYQVDIRAGNHGSLSQLKELGWAFFKTKLFRILEIFNAFYIAIIFYYSSMDARASNY